MNDDLISRSALKAEFDEKCAGECGVCAYHKWENYASLNAVSYCLLIDNAPTVDIKDQIAGAYNEGYVCGSREAEKARPQGEWIKVKEERMSVDMSGEIVTRYKCSKCGRIIATFPNKLVEYYPFCHCGADMQKGGAEK